MHDFIISNLKNIDDLDIIADEYAHYYQNSVLEEKWTKEKAKELFLYFYNHAYDLFFVAYNQDKPIGVIMTCLKPWWDGNHLEDTEIFVCEQYQKQGIAKNLFKKLFETAIEKYDANLMEAHTYEDENGFPYCWYKRLGFKTVDEWKIIRGDLKEILKKL